MFGMAELKLRIVGHLVCDNEIEALGEHYHLIDSATFQFKIGPAFLEPFDDNEPTTDVAMDENEEHENLDEANDLIVFDHGDDEA